MGTDGRGGWVLSAEGLGSLFCSRVLEELTSSSSPASSPPASTCRHVQKRERTEAEGRTFCPHTCPHERRLSSPQQIEYNPSASLEKLIDDYHINHCFHLSCEVSFFSSFFSFQSFTHRTFSPLQTVVDMEMGGIKSD